MNCLVVMFRGRNSRDISNKCLSEIYMNGPKFDIDLVSSDKQIVSAHKYVVCMFSTYLKNYILEFKPKGKACVPLSEISSFVLKQVIDLFYNGQIMIGAEVKPHIVKALVILKVPNVVIRQADEQQQPTPSTDVVAAPCLMPSRPEIATPKLPLHQNIDGDISVSNVQYLPAKRPRAQSVCTEPTRDSDMLFSNPSDVPSSIAKLSHIDSMSLTKIVKSNPITHDVPQNLQLVSSCMYKSSKQHQNPDSLIKDIPLASSRQSIPTQIGILNPSTQPNPTPLYGEHHHDEQDIERMDVAAA